VQTVIQENHIMSSGFPYFRSQGEEDLQALRGAWLCFLSLGIALIVLGVLALSFPAVATEAVVLFTGILLICGAGVEMASAFWSRRWSGLFLHLLCGLLYLFAGVIFLDRPGEGAEFYTLMLAIFFVAGGVIRIVLALERRFSGWGWTVVSGIIALVLGIMIWRRLPGVAFWVIGTFVGIDLLFNGWSWIMLALAVRTIPPVQSRVV
jgi:uncharacterized membrane protein HdeD (DUF308 family)